MSLTDSAEVPATDLERRRYLRERILLPDGLRFGEKMDDWQREDFETRDKHPARYRYLERPRGHSKTWDTAVNATVEMVLGPPGQRLYGLAADQDQGMLLQNDVAGIFERHPALRPLVKITSKTITMKATGSIYETLNSNAPTLYGLRPDRVYVDELVEHPRRDAWDALWSAVGKRPGCTVDIISTPGWDRTHFAWTVREHARTNSAWLFSSRGQCASWISSAFLEQQRLTLPAQVYARLHEGVWPPEGFGAWLSGQQVEAIFGPVPSGEGESCLGLDIGITRDRTVIARVKRLDTIRVVEELLIFTPTRQARVDLTEVEETLFRHAKQHACPVLCDPYQAVGLAQRLAQRGITIQEYPFTAEKRRALFARLLDVITTGRLRCTPHEEFRRELLSLETKETLAGWRVDHRASGHDDIVVAVSLALAGLAEPEYAPLELFTFDTEPKTVAEIEQATAAEYARRSQEAAQVVTDAIARDGVYWPGG